MIRFIYDKWRFDNKAKLELPELLEEYTRLGEENIESLDEKEIIVRIDALYDIHCRTTYFNIVIPLLMQVYFSILRSRLKSVNIEIDQFDLTEGMDELKDFDPGVHLYNLSCSYHQFDQPTQDAILSSTYSDFMQMSDIAEFQIEVESFMQSFGHLSDSGTDFSNVPWRENPEILLRIISEYDLVENTKRGQKRLDDVPFRGLSRWLFKLVYHRARIYRLYREDVSSLYTYGLGLFRTYYLALGDRFVDHRYLDERDDIFYLYDEEIRGCISGDVNGQNFRDLVSERKEEIESCADIMLPEIIYGESNPPPIVQTKNVLTGTPTSRGYYTGNTKILRGINDFHKLEKGDILVIPHSDVGWTPLFSKAGAVVAESGGILSHSSIIAREYNIPAVVSVDGAMQLSDSMLVTIDGYKGKVVVHDHDGMPE
jgi:pyruvate,water dikinase